MFAPQKNSNTTLLDLKQNKNKKKQEKKEVFKSYSGWWQFTIVQAKILEQFHKDKETQPWEMPTCCLNAMH